MGYANARQRGLRLYCCSCALSLNLTCNQTNSSIELLVFTLTEEVISWATEGKVYARATRVVLEQAVEKLDGTLGQIVEFERRVG